MQKINIQAMTDEILKGIEKSGERKTLLLHSCGNLREQKILYVTGE